MAFLVAISDAPSPPGAERWPACASNDAPAHDPWRVRTAESALLASRAPTTTWAPDDPETNNDLWIVFDGFLSCRDKLSRQLGLEGRAMQDAELIGRGYLRQGTSLLDKLDGQYGLVIVEPGKRNLIVKRDQLGARVLFLFRSPAANIVASACEFIARSPHYRFQENEQFIADLFVHHAPQRGEQTAFANIRQVQVGETIELHHGQVRSWRTPFDFGTPDKLSSIDEYVEAFSDLFGRAVASALPRDGDVAVMLSGGMDSGPMTLKANEHLDRSRQRLLITSWTFPDIKESDETRWIKTVAEQGNADTCLFDGSAFLPFSSLGEEMISPDSPVFNPHRLYINQCYKQAQQLGCRVILNGGCGDLLYPSHLLRLHDRVRRRQWAGFIQEMFHMLGDSGLAWILRALPGRSFAGRWLRSLKLRNSPPDSPYLSKTAFDFASPKLNWPPECSEHPLPGYAEQVLGSNSSFGPAHEAQFAEMFRIERRDPYQNQDLVKFMLHAPVSLSHKQGHKKWIMREATRSLLPDSVRLKPRTGNLVPVVRSGFDKYRQSMREFLSSNPAWTKYADEDVVFRTMGNAVQSDTEQFLLSKCIGYAIWHGHWRSASA